MFGLFGKKTRATPVDDAQRVLPKELWDGPMGQALRDAGLSPDEDANVLGMHPVDARIAKEKLVHEGRLAEENARIGAEHPGCRLATQFILTDDIWNGEHAELLLYALELTPYWQFNVRFLPADAGSAAALGLPVRHLGQFGDILRAAPGHIAELAKTHGLGDPAKARGASEAAKQAMQRDLAGLTNYYYEECILPNLRADPLP